MLYLFLWHGVKEELPLAEDLSRQHFQSKFLDEATFAGIRVLISESHTFLCMLIDGEKV